MERLDDPDGGRTTASPFDVQHAAGLEDRRTTVVLADGSAVARTTLRSVSPNAVRLEDRDDLAPGDRCFIHDSVSEAIAVRVREAKIQTEQATRGRVV